MAKLRLRHPFKALSGRLSRDMVIKHFKASGVTLMVARRGPDRVRRQEPGEAAAQLAFSKAVYEARRLLKDPKVRREYEARAKLFRRKGRSVSAWNLALSDLIKSHRQPK
jgi:hypothetical protein